MSTYGLTSQSIKYDPWASLPLITVASIKVDAPSASERPSKPLIVEIATAERPFISILSGCTSRSMHRPTEDERFHSRILDREWEHDPRSADHDCLGQWSLVVLLGEAWLVASQQSK